MEVFSWSNQERLHNDDDNLSLEDVPFPRLVSCMRWRISIHTKNFYFNVTDIVQLSDKINAELALFVMF